MHIFVAHEQDQFHIVYTYIIRGVLGLHSGQAHTHVQASGTIGISVATAGVIGPVCDLPEFFYGRQQGHGRADYFQTGFFALIVSM